MNARTESAILGLGGVRISPLVLLGEEDDFGPGGPDAQSDPVEKRLALQAEWERQAALKAKRWMPAEAPEVTRQVDDLIHAKVDGE